MAKSTVSMKLLIDTGAKRVLFAEAGKDCIDFLFHILTLPIATVIRLLKEEGMVGSLPNLYKSLENLNDAFIQPDKNKDTYLKPAAPVSGCPVPLLAFQDGSTSNNCFSRQTTPPTAHESTFYFHNAPGGFGQQSAAHGFSLGQQSAASGFGLGLGQQSAAHGFGLGQKSAACGFGQQTAAGEGGLVKGVVTYMVMDDLEIKPLSTICTITLLNKFNVKEVGALEEKFVTLGMKEAIKLLKASLQSQKVLTDVFCY